MQLTISKANRIRMRGTALQDKARNDGSGYGTGEGTGKTHGLNLFIMLKMKKPPAERLVTGGSKPQQNGALPFRFAP